MIVLGNLIIVSAVVFMMAMAIRIDLSSMTSADILLVGLVATIVGQVFIKIGEMSAKKETKEKQAS